MSITASLSARKQAQNTLGWRVLIDSALPAKAQMLKDVELAQEEVPTVRFFCWSPPAISLGLKQKPPAWLEYRQWQQAGLESVERPTGGGIGFHGSDVSIAVIVPRRIQVPLDLLMDAVCQNALMLVQSLNIDAHTVLETPAAGRIDYCLTENAPYAVMVGSKKAAGFALRRFPKTWLIQGSLLVRPLPDALAGAIPEPVLMQLKSKAVALSEASKDPLTEADVALRWSQQWAAGWEETLLETLSKAE